MVEKASRLSWKSVDFSANGSPKEHLLRAHVCQQQLDSQKVEPSSINLL